MNTEDYIQATAGDGITSDGDGITPDPAPARFSALRHGWARLPRVVQLALIPVVTAAAVALLAGQLLTSSTPQTPADVLRADGYTLTGAQDKAQMTAAGDFTGDGKMLEPYVTGLAVGVKGSRTEGVLQLTGSGKNAITAMLPLIIQAGGMGQGVTAHMNGSFMVIDGPAGTLGNGTLG